VEEERKGWRKLRELKIDKKKLSRRMRKAETSTTRHAHRFIIKRLDNIRSVRRHIISWLLLVGVMILAVGAQFIWFQRSYQTTAAAHGGTYAEASLGPVETLNPLYASSSAEMAAARLMFSSLYQYDETGN
jgi:peptide/nickel transport system substrate-binding protein